MSLSEAAPADRPRVSLRGLALIVVGNLIPILGVRFLGWDAAQILILYWVENLIVGVFTVPRILTARGGAMSGRDRFGFAAFFTLHYGFFWLIHGVFAWTLAGDLARQDGAGAGVWPRTFGTGDFRWALLVIAVVHAVMFLREWRLSGLWRTAAPNGEMLRPYGRMVILHVTVLVGAWSLLELGAPTSTVLLLCVGKMLLELTTEILAGLLRER